MLKKEAINNSFYKAKTFAQIGWRWWVSEMAAMIPESIIQKMASPKQSIVISFENANVVVRSFDARGVTEIHRVTLQALEAMDAPLQHAHATASIALPAENAFIDHFKVPMTARAKLRQAVSFEVKRRSPFRTDDALFDFSSTSMPGDKILNVEWATIPEDLIERSKAVAYKLGYFPTAVGIAANSNDKDLKYIFDRQKYSSRRRIGKPFAILAASVVFFVCVAFYAASQRASQAEALNNAASALKVQAQQAEATRESATRLQSALAFVSNRLGEPKVLDILAEVTSVLPNDSWVSEFNLKGNQLELVGYSANASSLIGHFSSTPLFEHAHFLAPITPQPNSNSERFDIAVTITGRQQAEAGE
jgi:general secretion pathway protein L